MLREKKGHDLLIRAAIELDATLRIVGDGPQRAELEGLITELGANDRVHLLGLKTPEEVRALLDAADVFCLASRPVASGDRDGVPNVLIEAMARGVPVVSTRLSGIPDLVAPERGVLVDPDDEKALAAGLRRVLDDPGGAASRAATALEHVSSEYVTDVNWSKLEALMRLAVA